MRIAIAGAHGQIAQRLILKLVADGHSVVGLIRNPEHAWEIKELGADASLCDLELEPVTRVAQALEGSDGAVFAAGAGPDSGPERKLSLDRDGAITFLQAAVSAEVPRFVIVSSVGAEAPPQDDSEFSVYLQAKAGADAAVQASDRRWTIIRPGALTDDPGTGCARVDTEPYRGRVSRDDVAAVLLATLDDSRSEGAILYVNGGEQPIADALAGALGPRPA
jgi:nucleoside-diphosphate-sugar epimerase